MGGRDRSQPDAQACQYPKKLILAAGDAALGKCDPPPELEMGWDCDRFGALPEPGGALDQTAGELTRIRAVLNVYSAVRSWDQSGGTRMQPAFGLYMQYVHDRNEGE